jgi:2-polyprenyl-3-methyl-5-hydroxy-6-metoxy-1,4-benzoquinol methylase
MVIKWLNSIFPGLFAQQNEIDVLYRILFNRINDLDESLDIISKQSQLAFSDQWKEIPSGNALLSDPWFRSNVTRILSEEELQVSADWFKGKKVLDAGCGNGRWSYGLAQLGCDVTAVDINTSGLNSTKEVLGSFQGNHRVILSALEDLYLDEKFDLVFSWGVLHHCHSFTKSLQNLSKLVDDDGMLYLYLYGRESLSYDQDIALFKKRMYYNSLPDKTSRYKYLLEQAHGDADKVHNYHDLLAPLINRRLNYNDVSTMLQKQGFNDIVRTIPHTELFIRAIKNPESLQPWILPQKTPPFWFSRYC